MLPQPQEGTVSRQLVPMFLLHEELEEDDGEELTMASEVAEGEGEEEVVGYVCVHLLLNLHVFC